MHSSLLLSLSKILTPGTVLHVNLEDSMPKNKEPSTKETDPGVFELEEFPLHKPTLLIGKTEVPRPFRGELRRDQLYWVPCLESEEGVRELVGFGEAPTPEECASLRRGLVHTTREAAKLHCDALVSFTQGESSGFSIFDFRQ